MNILHHPDYIGVADEIQLLRHASEQLDELVDRVEGVPVNGDIGEGRKRVVKIELDGAQCAMENYLIRSQAGWRLTIDGFIPFGEIY